jgi:hypothetical protein
MLSRFADNPSSKAAARDAFCVEGLSEMIANGGVVEFGAAGKNIDGGVAVLGPGVNRHMRFGYDHDAAYAIRTEVMEYSSNNASAAGADGGAKQRFDVPRPLEPARVAPIKIEQCVMSESSHV